MKNPDLMNRAALRRKIRRYLNGNLRSVPMALRAELRALGMEPQR